MKKKFYQPLPKVTEFFRSQPVAIVDEYVELVERLEAEGRLVYPYAEKVEAGLFALRLRCGGNVRVFYVYDTGSVVYGVHAYEKKSRCIPGHELELARKLARVLLRGDK